MATEKLRVMFVDDEPKILDGLRRKMRSMRKEWTMGFASGGYEAKRMLLEGPWDVIVTDMRMPGTSGQELLTIVQEKYPHMLRIVLSGYSDREIIMQTTRTAHQYLSKPTSVENIKSAIMRSMVLRKLLKEERLIKLASQLNAIPSVPSVYNEIMQELQKEDSSLVHVGEIIEHDPGMSAKILQIVNSAFFGIAKHVESPSRAVVMLGMDIIRSLVLSIHLFQSFEESDVNMNILNMLQHHALSVASRAQNLARFLKLDTKMVDYAFMGGLLHDVGCLVFLAEFPATYQELLMRSASESKPLQSLEVEAFHASHAELGAYLMGLWGLQEPVIEAIAFHHNPSSVSLEVPTALTCVHMANVFDYQDNTMRSFGLAPTIDVEMMEALKLMKSLKKLQKLSNEE